VRFYLKAKGLECASSVRVPKHEALNSIPVLPKKKVKVRFGPSIN
jgi:hypothetical protein